MTTGDPGRQRSTILWHIGEHRVYPLSKGHQFHSLQFITTELICDKIRIPYSICVGRTSDTRVRVVTRGNTFCILLMLLLFLIYVLSTDVSCT